MSDTFIIDHGTIINAFMFIMFIVCIAYTVWVMVLDLCETRAEAEADTMSQEAYEFQAAVQRRMEADRAALNDIQKGNRP